MTRRLYRVVVAYRTPPPPLSFLAERGVMASSPVDALALVIDGLGIPYATLGQTLVEPAQDLSVFMRETHTALVLGTSLTLAEFFRRE